MANPPNIQTGDNEINTVLRYVEAVERKQDQYIAMMDKTYSNHISSIEAKLDKLVEITSTVAQLQTQQNIHSAEVGEVKAGFKELNNSTKVTISRLHDRLDEITTSVSTVDGRRKEHVSVVDNKVNKWINRFMGGYLVSVFLVSIIGWFVIRYMNSAEEIIANHSAQIQKLNTKSTECELRLGNLKVQQ